MLQRTFDDTIDAPDAVADVAVRRTESPSTTLAAPGETVSSGGSGSTTICAVSGHPPALPMIRALPGMTAVTNPCDDTVATAGSAERQSTK